MRPLQVKSVAEQVAAHLREEMLSGGLVGEMPGIKALAEELGANHKTVEAAMRLLEKEGLLTAQGRGQRRRITLPKGGTARRPLRIAILNHDPLALTEGYIIELQHLLQEAGFTAFFSDKCLLDLQMDVKRVAWQVKQMEADAWVVVGGSRGVLEWFVGREIPVFALFGRRRELPLAGVGPDKVRAIRSVIRRLVELGHQRIVFLTLTARRLPEPGLPERAFLEELESHGIQTGPYNLPNWKETPEGLGNLLDSLLRVTPPTAFLLDEAYLFHAVKHHLSERGIRSPEDVSLICTDPDRTFTWCRPSIAHIDWNASPMLRRILRWVQNLARGKPDLRQTLTHAEFVEGGTIGRGDCRL
jgi:DNA-binding LacI/PurR family transcriptional regulator